MKTYKVRDGGVVYGSIDASNEKEALDKWQTANGTKRLPDSITCVQTGDKFWKPGGEVGSRATDDLEVTDSGFIRFKKGV